ncbi:phospholipase-like protein [Tanacetum coccineum]
MRQAWFMASVDFIKELADQDDKFFQDDEARVYYIEHNNGMCGDTEVGKFMQDEEARVNGIEHHNGMCGDTEVGKFVQDKEARVNGIEHHNEMCGDTEDSNFVKGIDETVCLKSNQMSVEEGDGVLDSEGDGVHLSQTNDVIQQVINLSTMSSTSPQAINPVVAEFFFPEFDALKKEVFLLKKRKDDEFDELTKRFSKLETSQTFPSSSSSNTRNEKDASHLDDLMEIDGENLSYTNSQDHLNLLIKALESKTENPTLDVVVPLKDDDCILRTRKPNDAYDVVEVDNYEDDYMLMLNDEEKHVKSSLNDMELEQEPDKIDVKQGILEQQPNAPKGKTTVFEETVWVKVEEKPGLGRGVGPLKVKKKNCQRAFRPNYLLRSTKDRKKKLAMALKPPFGQQSATTPDISGQPRIGSINDIMTHEPFVENLSRPGDCKSDKVTVPEHMCEFITNKDLPEYRFPWGKRDIVIGRSFWLSLSCLNTGKAGWLNDHVYFLVNEPKTHWCLAELEIRTGVVTFYNSLGWASGSRRRWWRRMKKLLPEKLTVYLVMHGILESKGISADDYKITYKYADAPFQASLFGDYGIRALPTYMLALDQNLTYSPHSIMATLWNPSIKRSINILVHAFTSQPKTDKILLGFGVRPDTLNPTIIKVSYPRDGQRSWYVSVFTLSSMDWNKMENGHLPREYIRFKRSSQAVVGRLLFSAGHESYVKLHGFSNDEIPLPTVEVPGAHQLANVVQLFNLVTQSFQNLGIQGVAGSFYIEPYKESLILLPYPDRAVYYMFLA